MSDFIRFDSSYALAGSLSERGEEEIKAEPMLFSADRYFAHENGGLITREFLKHLPDDWGWDIVIDSRVHMLMPGWYPCIPGWHLDDVPRTRPDGQPDHVNPAYRAEHAMAIVGDASRTHFAVGELGLEDVPVGGGTVYGKWTKAVDALVGCGEALEVEVPQCRVVLFDWQSFHRGMAATKGGWRFFIRASRKTRRPVLNQIRQQVQVYLPTVDAGW